MPVVPQYNAPQVRESNVPNVSVPTNAPIEAFGGGGAVQGPEKALIGFGEAVKKEVDKANQIASTEAHTQIASQKQDLINNPQYGMITKKGKDALASIGDYEKKFDDSVSKISEGLNSDQQAQFKLRAAQEKIDFMSQINRHGAVEGEKYDNEVTDSRIGTARNDAVLGYQNPDTVTRSIADQKQAIEQYAVRANLPPELLKLKIGDAESKTHVAVLDRMLANGQTGPAKEYYAANKDRIDGTVITGVEKSLKASEQLDRSVATWDSVKGFKLADGTPDESKMQAAIMSDKSLSSEEKEAAWNYTKTRSAEQIANKSRVDSANDRAYLNLVSSMKKNGSSLDDAIRQISKYATDDYDKTVKEAQARKIYAPKEASDPNKFLSLWEKTQDGTATKQDIDKGFNSGDINVSDHRLLREEIYKADVEGKSPQAKQAWDRVKILAADEFGNKEDREKFIYEMHQSASGKSPDEIWKMAQDKIKTDPNTGAWGFFQSKQYKTDLEKRDANNLAWGQAHNDIGKAETLAIGQGMSMITKKPFSPADLEAFSSQVGGYGNIKKGQPGYNAIQSLIKYSQPVTPNNVNWVLEQHPDGKF